MKIKQLFDDDSGVSPVIGVILMVAITVILAAVIGTFVLDLGQNVNNSAPTVSFDFEQTTGTAVEITHNGGAELAEDSTTIQCNGGTKSDPSYPWTAGDTATCNDPGDTINIVWEDPDSDQTSVIGTYDTS